MRNCLISTKQIVNLHNNNQQINNAQINHQTNCQIELNVNVHNQINQSRPQIPQPEANFFTRRQVENTSVTKAPKKPIPSTSRDADTML